MQRTGAVQVVLGEGEPGLLRLILEAQGFAVIGHARGDDELRLVLSVTDPSVVVLDAGISVQAALEARGLAEGVPIVAVWPSGVTAVIADERVDPEQAFQDLGDAVRRAASRTWIEEDVVRLPEADEAGPPPVRQAHPDYAAAIPEPDPAPVPAQLRRGRRLLVTAAAWVLSLTALTTIGLAVPGALRVFEERDRAPRPSVQERPTSSREPREDRAQPRPSPPERSEGACEPKGEEAQGSPSDRGRPEDPGLGCGPDRGKAGEEHGQGRGRPDEPGERGQGKGSDRKEGGDPAGSGGPPDDAGGGRGNGGSNAGDGGGNDARGGNDRNPNG